ncbi:MAG: glutamate--cysteine ligase [Propionicimonas sp.]
MGKVNPPRSFGVEEELLLVDAVSRRPAALGEVITAAAGPSATRHRLTAELKQDQLEVVVPPQTSFQAQLDAIRTGRALADQAAAAHGARVVALSTSPWPGASGVVPGARNERIRHGFGITAVEQLTCGFHVHVGVDSAEQGVAVLDRLRGWLPVVLALSTNSPFWQGRDSGFASYRYQVWSRWPTAGPTGIFGSAAAYHRRRDELLGTGVPLDDGMLYYDARLSVRYPTVEIRVADVCLVAEHAAAIATLVRALVEASARQTADGVRPAELSSALLRAWSWRASRYGLTEALVDPATGVLAPAVDVVARLLDFVADALVEDEREPVREVVDDILRRGTGAERQRSLRPQTGGLSEAEVVGIVEFALRTTHHEVDGPVEAPVTGTRDLLPP